MSFEEKFRHIRLQVDAKPHHTCQPSASSSRLVAIKRTKSSLITKLPKSDSGKRRVFTRLPSSAGHSDVPLVNVDILDWLADRFNVKTLQQYRTKIDREKDKWKQMTSRLNHTIQIPLLPSHKEYTADEDGTVNDNGCNAITQYLDMIKKQEKQIKCGTSYLEASKISVHSSFKKPEKIKPHLIISKPIEETKEREIRILPDIDSSVMSPAECLTKIKSIYSILCFLSNIKSRDLKSKSPLMVSTLRYLSQKPRQSIVRTQEHGLTKSAVASEPKQPITKIFEPQGERYPPWQMKIVFVNTAQKEKEIDLQKRILACSREFEHLRCTLGYNMLHKLKTRSEYTNKQLLNKLQELEYGPNSTRQLQSMRDKSGLHSIMEKNKNEEKFQWYNLLHDEVNTILCNESSLLSFAKQLLDKLHQFTIYDPVNISSVLEKFCLYVMSLPAYKLCRKPVINAIKFVLEFILHTSPKLCTEWLQLRQLPWQQ